MTEDDENNANDGEQQEDGRTAVLELALGQLHYKVEWVSQTWQEVGQSILELSGLLEILIYNLPFLMKLIV